MKNPVLSLNNREIKIFHSNVLVIPQTNCLQPVTFIYFRSEVISTQIVFTWKWLIFNFYISINIYTRDCVSITGTVALTVRVILDPGHTSWPHEALQITADSKHYSVLMQILKKCFQNIYSQIWNHGDSSIIILGWSLQDNSEHLKHCCQDKTIGLQYSIGTNYGLIVMTSCL